MSHPIDLAEGEELTEVLDLIRKALARSAETRKREAWRRYVDKKLPSQDVSTRKLDTKAALDRAKRSKKQG